MNRKLLEGKTAIVTGGSSGIGLGIAKIFLEEGANVVITGRNREKLGNALQELHEISEQVIGVSEDICSSEGIDRTLKQTIDKFGDLDILVNNAGHGSGQLSIEATDDAFLDAVLDTNLRAVFIFCRKALQYMMKKNDGVIINVSSVNGKRPLTGSAYCASKFGVVGLTQNLGVRFTNTGIRVNGICPGIVVTPMTEAFNQTVDGDAGPGIEEGSMHQIVNRYSNRNAQCTERQIADAALFLASDLGSGVQGQSIMVDCGGYL